MVISSLDSAKSTIQLKPINHYLGNQIIEKYHYLHKAPSGSQLVYGIFEQNKIQGVIIFGSTSGQNVRRIVLGTTGRQTIELTRLWLSDNLPKNSESKVIAIAIRLLKKVKP